jgi:molybdenum cofactor cytidylyltransferase
MLSLIVLAAGKSSRMRGRNKLLAKIKNQSIIRRVVEAGLKSKADEVIVVLGWQADKIRKALDELPCRFVVNKDYEKGQSSSVKAGLNEVGEMTQAILILPGDIVAAHEGKPGHPILLAKELFNEIGEIAEDSFGLKAVIQKHKREMRLVEDGSPNVLLDVDTPEDLKNL